MKPGDRPLGTGSMVLSGRWYAGKEGFALLLEHSAEELRDAINGWIGRHENRGGGRLAHLVLRGTDVQNLS